MSKIIKTREKGNLIVITGSFDNITREEIATVISRAFKL